ncbi:N2,N2-dimethylguanosine tRNA methyltransferase [Synechococcus sp. KORDI-52]|nr:N2,N2-dimethylguanosine tRNA methyltransferase [Synechococcus sp. KORDI-52]
MLCTPHSAVWIAADGTLLSSTEHHYREGLAELSLGPGFFRAESRPARDLSVLLARHQRSRATRSLRWLDLMAGCGIRALRWGLEAVGGHAAETELWINDGDPDRLALIQANLQPLQGAIRLTADAADTLLHGAILKRKRFDFIDLDAFGAPGALIQPALQALRFEGLLFLASTDGRSPTGHDRVGAIRSLGAAARAHPASWEMALRQQIGLVARQAWMLGHGLQPLFSFSEGRTFRLALRLRRRIPAGDERNLGLVARCERCGAQRFQPLLKLSGWPACSCADGQGRWSVSGPLWIGPLQEPLLLLQLMADAQELNRQQISPITLRLMQRLQADPGDGPTVWSTDELARRLGLGGPPALGRLVRALQAAGHRASASGVMPGQVRTDAELPELLQICTSLRGEGL